MKSILKRILSPKWRILLRVYMLYCKDVLQGNQVRFAKKRMNNVMPNCPFFIEIQQPIRKNAFSENKIYNLKIAAEKLEKVIIYPQEIFSFWHLIGEPSESQNFKIGRVIAGNELSADVGGGLCQLAGILYYLSLQGGLEIVERHAHSFDLYTEKDRYTPLGSDAAVAYGYKDFRFKNTLDTPVRFAFDIQNDKITGLLKSCKIIEKQEVCFTIISKNQIKKVTTIRRLGNGEIEAIDVSNYRTFIKKGSKNPKIP